MIERELTALMYELLSPEKNSECGRLYLELFDKHVLRLEMTADELDSAKFYKERHTRLIPSSRPMDLVITTSKRFIPIEFKMENGSDRDGQCYDYWQEAKSQMSSIIKSAEPPVLYYLSPQGYFPEINSAGKLGYDDYPFIRSDKIDDVSFRSELFHWVEECLAQTPKNFSCRKKLEQLRDEICLIIGKRESRTEKLMRKLFAALDERFDENFCKRYRLKRRMIQPFEDSNWQREILKFFFKGHCAPYINFHCTDSAGNIIKFGADKELLFGAECYNGGENDFKQTRIFGADFAIYDKSIGNYICEKTDVKQLLDGKNILPQEFIKAYRKKFAGCIGRIALHDANGNTIDFHNVEETLAQFETQEDIDAAVETIMTEIKALLRRFVYG